MRTIAIFPNALPTCGVRVQRRFCQTGVDVHQTSIMAQAIIYMDYGLQIMDYGSWIVDYGLQIADYGLWKGAYIVLKQTADAINSGASLND